MTDAVTTPAAELPPDPAVAVEPAPEPTAADDAYLLDSLFEHLELTGARADRDVVTRAFHYANEHHVGQKRKSGEAFIVHPVEVAKLVAELLMDQDSIVAALLHDVVEDTPASVEEVSADFGADVAHLVEGVTNLTRIHFASREEQQVENYRRMIVAMAKDHRVILIKLCDRLHNMRTLRFLPKQKQLVKAKETVEIYAPIAHRLGIHSVKWELEDLSFQVLYPRKYQDIQQMVQQRKSDRERLMLRATGELRDALTAAGIEADIKGRTKHFYSIFQKMQAHAKEFNEIYDLTGIRVLVDEIKDCYGAIGIIHATWTPLPGRFKDYIAMPKLNGYQSLHTTVVGPGGKPLEIQVRTVEQHRTAEYGIAAHFRYKERVNGTGPASKGGTGAADDWIRNILEWEGQASEPSEFMEALHLDLYQDEIYVFTPRGEVKNLAAGATPLDFAYSVHTDVGHRCVGAKVNGRIVPLGHTLESGDRVEVLTSNNPGKGPSRDWSKIVKTNRAKSKIRQFFAKEKREDYEQKGRDSLAAALKQQSIPHAKIQHSAMFASIIRELGFKKAEDFYVAIGSSKFSPNVVVNKVLQQLKTQEAVPDESAADVVRVSRPKRLRSGDDYGIRVEGIADSTGIQVRMAKCCKPVPGDDVRGYISLGKGITIHRADCSNVQALLRTPERFTPVHWDGQADAAFRVEVQVEGWDRARLLEDISRTIAEHGCNIVAHSGIVEDQLVKERFTLEIGDTRALKGVLSALRNIDSIFDAYRVTPG